MIMIYWSRGNNSIIKKADKIRDKLKIFLFNFSLKKKSNS